MSLWSVKHLTISIARPPAEVYAYAVDPRHLPAWASGLAGAIREVEGTWRADSPMGEVRVAFAPRNALGVLDHDVTLPDGTTVHNPMRVMANAEGSEVVFTLFRLPGVTDAQLAVDAATVVRDLQTLKHVLERSPR